MQGHHWYQRFGIHPSFDGDGDEKTCDDVLIAVPAFGTRPGIRIINPELISQAVPKHYNFGKRVLEAGWDPGSHVSPAKQPRSLVSTALARPRIDGTDLRPARDESTPDFLSHLPSLSSWPPLEIATKEWSTVLCDLPGNDYEELFPDGSEDTSQPIGRLPRRERIADWCCVALSPGGARWCVAVATGGCVAVWKSAL